MKVCNNNVFGIIIIILFFVGCKKNDYTIVNKEGESTLTNTPHLEPFADNNGEFPPPNIYDGPFFKANYNYPSNIAERSYPWQDVLAGEPLTKYNAEAYIMSVRQYIADDMRIMIDQPNLWQNSPNRQNWYNMGWSGQSYNTNGWNTGWEGLETIYGTMTGQVLKDDIFTDYGFEGPMQNHALVYYNDVAAVTLNNLWKSYGPSGFFPNYTTAAAQFKQNAIIIKAAGTTASAEEWSVLEGSGTFNIYREAAFGPDKGKGNILQELTWIQFDIIIKDSVASPETGWVFSTFIYDNSTPVSSSTFDRLNLLGVAWGNDPGKMQGNEALEETYINPNAPPYSNVTLGYGRRLSGPIDVALVGGTRSDMSKDSVYVLGPDGGADGSQKFLKYTASACMSCHSTASFPPQNDFYPSPDPTRKLVFSDTLFNPASSGWSNYYQNRSGTAIMPNSTGYNKSIMALDYDLFMQFALNNSLLGHKYLPKNTKRPDGYTFWETSEHGPQLRTKSK